MISIGNNQHQEYEAMLLSPFCIDRALSPEEVKRMVETAEQLSEMQQIESEDRRFEMGWLPYEDSTAWIYGRLYDLVQAANEGGFFFDPIDMIEPISYNVYKEGSCFDWHYDLASHPPLSSRKLAIVVNLSDSDDYRGGEFEFSITPDKQYHMNRALGTVIIYPAYLINRIRPVTQGCRKSFIFWVGGTSFA